MAIVTDGGVDMKWFEKAIGTVAFVAFLAGLFGLIWTVG
jgi:hypothetical protein